MYYTLYIIHCTSPPQSVYHITIPGYRLWKVWKRDLSAPANLRTRIGLITLINLLIAGSIPLVMVLWKLLSRDPHIYAYFSGTSCQSTNYELVLEKDTSSTFYLQRLITRLYLGVITGLGVMLTILVNISTAVLAWGSTRRAGNGVPQRTMVTLGAVAWTFVVSYTPVLVYTMWSMRRPDSHRGFLLLTHCCLGLNVCANPIIYGVSNKKFRGYVSNRFSVAQFNDPLESGQRETRSMSVLSVNVTPKVNREP